MWVRWKDAQGSPGGSNFKLGWRTGARAQARGGRAYQLLIRVARSNFWGDHHHRSDAAHHLLHLALNSNSAAPPIRCIIEAFKFLHPHHHRPGFFAPATAPARLVSTLAQFPLARPLTGTLQLYTNSTKPHGSPPRSALKRDQTRGNYACTLLIATRVRFLPNESRNLAAPNGHISCEPERFEHSISPSSIRRTWPEATVKMAARPATPASPKNIKVKGPAPGSPLFGCGIPNSPLRHRQ